MDTYEAYLMGRDSIISGADTINCNFSIFATEELKQAWEYGRNDAKNTKLEEVKGE